MKASGPSAKCRPMSRSVGAVHCTHSRRRLVWMAAVGLGVLAAAWGGGNSACGAADRRDRFAAERRRMVEEYLIREGIENRRVLAAMLKVPRHEFVPATQRARAYHDMALPIGYGQTISPPFIVAYMTESIDPQPADRVLEIGTGSGYQAAVLSELAREVYSIEIVEPLARTAERRLKSLGYKNVTVRAGDGYEGWPEKAPFDKIIVTCSPEDVPRALVQQLREGGRMIIPLGQRYQQMFYLFQKKDGRLVAEKLIPTLFVPMTGKAEENRKVQPDPLHPKVVNGGFEADENNDELADGWHYQRQTSLHSDGAPEGAKYLRLQCDDPDRVAQLLQGFAVDGRAIGRLRLRFSLRTRDVRYSRAGAAQGGVMLYFYDRVRRPLGEVAVMRWENVADWERQSRTIAVPSATREAILWFGVKSATGIVDLDDVSIEPLRR